MKCRKIKRCLLQENQLPCLLKFRRRRTEVTQNRIRIIKIIMASRVNTITTKLDLLVAIFSEVWSSTASLVVAEKKIYNHVGDKYLERRSVF